MLVNIRVFGLLKELLKKEIPCEASFYRVQPVTLREALSEIGISGDDLLWVVVYVNGELTKKDIFDDYLDKNQVDITVYPLFAGG